MVSLNKAASNIQQLSYQAKKLTPDGDARVADMLSGVAEAIQDLDYSLEALELIVSTLAAKQGLTASQVRREGVAPLHPNPRPAALRFDKVSVRIEQILALADK